MNYILAIDGGGSKTLAYLGNENGRIVSSHITGPINYHSIGIEKTTANIDELIRAICIKADIDRSKIGVLSSGIAGVNRDADKIIMEQVLRNVGIIGDIIINNDAVTALIGALGKKEGVITICGTGSISFGISKAGSSARSGGWGHIIGDEGSGYYIGIECLRAVMRCNDGRADKTALTDKVLSFLDLDSYENIMGYVYDKDTTKDHIAKLAPLLFEAVQAGDVTAIRIMHKAAHELAVVTRAVIDKIYQEAESVDVTYGGSLLEKSDLFRNCFINKLKSQEKIINIKTPLFNSAIGAMILGWNQRGIDYDIATIRKNLEAII